MPPKPRPLYDRFIEKINKDGPNGCWLWAGAKDKQGYGRIGTHTGPKHNKSEQAHRVAYKLYIGPIEEGQCVLHKCDTPSCVFPGHLFLGTPEENEADKQAKGRQLRGEEHGRAFLNDLEVREIRVKNSIGSYTQKELADAYGVSRSCIQAIVSHKSWKHVA